MLQLVLVSCVSGTSRKNMSPTKKQRRAKFFATDQHEIHHHCWYSCDVYLKQLYSAYYAWDILETKKQHRWNSDWNSYIFHATPGSWQGRSAKREDSWSSWHLWIFLLPHDIHVKSWPGWITSNMNEALRGKLPMFCLFQNPVMTIFLVLSYSWYSW